MLCYAMLCYNQPTLGGAIRSHGWCTPWVSLQVVQLQTAALLIVVLLELLVVAWVGMLQGRAHVELS